MNDYTKAQSTARKGRRKGELDANKQFMADLSALRARLAAEDLTEADFKKAERAGMIALNEAREKAVKKSNRKNTAAKALLADVKAEIDARHSSGTR
jgi:hypothetical protein